MRLLTSPFFASLFCFGLATRVFIKGLAIDLAIGGAKSIGTKFAIGFSKCFLKKVLINF